MTNDLILTAMFEKGKSDALNFQVRSTLMDGTAMYAEEQLIPTFEAAKNVENMIDRPINFVCITKAGHVVKLLQPYDSDIYTAEPEELSAQWGFVWSTDPAKARPFISISTSPYMIGDCCIENEKIYRSILDNNVWAPSGYPQGWEEV